MPCRPSFSAQGLQARLSLGSYTQCMVPARIEGMGVDPGNGNLIVMLKAENNLFLPVVIGALETQNIMVHLSGEKPPRPLGPDLFYNTLDLLGVKVLRLEIVALFTGGWCSSSAAWSTRSTAAPPTAWPWRFGPTPPF